MVLKPVFLLASLVEGFGECSKDEFVGAQCRTLKLESNMAMLIALTVSVSPVPGGPSMPVKLDKDSTEPRMSRIYDALGVLDFGLRSMATLYFAESISFASHFISLAKPPALKNNIYARGFAVGWNSLYLSGRCHLSLVRHSVLEEADVDWQGVLVIPEAP